MREISQAPVEPMLSCADANVQMTMTGSRWDGIAAKRSDRPRFSELSEAIRQFVVRCRRVVAARNKRIDAHQKELSRQIDLG